jgi:FAD/FMN-containing dehydrogenase
MTVGTFPWQQVLAKRLGITVNDVHSQLNPTIVQSISTARTEADVLQTIRATKHSRSSLSICGARHAAGGQQFLSDGVLLDMSEMNKVIRFDQDAGLITVQSGIHWDEMQKSLDASQSTSSVAWGINQKQTGLNTLTIGGTVGANAHGQGLSLKPFVGDIESFRIINSDGQKLRCSRQENPELFYLVIGGYGLFGVVTDVTLKLIRRQMVRRSVKQVPVASIGTEFDTSISKGYRYGHCQINIDSTSPGYLKEGVFCTYEPVDSSTPGGGGSQLTQDGWLDLVILAHKDKKAAFKNYSNFLLSTDQAVDWADVWQSNFYMPNYHSRMGESAAHSVAASEVLSEFYVPVPQLENFLAKAREYFLLHNVDVIFSTVRFIQRDDETFLPWARQQYACVIFNFHTIHSVAEINKTMDAYSYLIDRAIDADGSFYLTYQHVANKQQLLTCYPQFENFLKLKLKYDPTAVFQSDWYRWHRRMF